MNRKNSQKIFFIKLLKICVLYVKNELLQKNPAMMKMIDCKKATEDKNKKATKLIIIIVN